MVRVVGRGIHTSTWLTLWRLATRLTLDNRAVDCQVLWDVFFNRHVHKVRTGWVRSVGTPEAKTRSREPSERSVRICSSVLYASRSEEGRQSIKVVCHCCGSKPVTFGRRTRFPKNQTPQLHGSRTVPTLFVQLRASHILGGFDSSADFGESGDGRVVQRVRAMYKLLRNVPQDRWVTVEKFGKYDKIMSPGLGFAGCDVCGACISFRAITSRVEQNLCKVQTKTKDNVFVTVKVAVQQSVVPERVEDAMYKLTNVHEQVGRFLRLRRGSLSCSQDDAR